jgi:hypothetical protein
MTKYKSQAKRASILKRMNSGLTESEFIDLIAQSQTDSKSYSEDEHHMAEWLINKKWKKWKVANVSYSEEQNLLFYHWYERRYNKNIINVNVLKNLFQAWILEWYSKYEEEEIEYYLEDNIQRHFKSERFPGHTKYYEFYYDFFPEIEKFDYNDFRGKEFINYLLKLFPKISSLNYMSRKAISRFTPSELKDLDEWRTHNPLFYNKFRMPSFIPSIVAEKNYDYTHEMWNAPPIIKTLHSDFQKAIKKNITNEIRVERNLPKIGEGWISETRLYYEIKKAFPKLEVKHHGNPNWLGRQHFDIYFPDLNIAIEYQGTQHQKPVEYFGGEEAFKKGRERDEKKKRLCEENGCKLFYVYPEDDTKKFIKYLKKYIKKLFEE